MTEEQLDFGLFQYPLASLLQLLKSDLGDDWYRDPLGYEDYFKDKKRFFDFFQNNIKNHAGVYTPNKSEVLDVPKKGGLIRYSLECHVYDRIAYHLLGVILVKRFDKLLSPRILSHRLAPEGVRGGAERYLFLNSVDQWKKFDAYTHLDAENKYIVIADVQNYYEQIRFNLLKDELYKCLLDSQTDHRTLAALRFCIDAIIDCLGFWGFNNSTGLPQNRDISSFLASIYLRPVDSYLINKGYDYYRYLDDIRIICDSLATARIALQELIQQLRILGLNVNSQKTCIKVPESPEHREYTEQTSLELEMIDSMIGSKKKPLVALGIKKCIEGVWHLFKEDPLIEKGRQFRFYVHRISRISCCKEFKVLRNELEELIDPMMNLLTDAPDCTDQVYLYLASSSLSPRHLDVLERYLLNPQIAIYSWQNYLLWKLLILKEHYSAPLIMHSRSILANSESKKPDKAGALLYLGAFGAELDLLNISNMDLISESSFVQRHMIIALQRLKYGKLNEKCRNSILKEHRGSYHYLRDYGENVFVLPPQIVKYTDIIRGVSIYA
jgi:hypothetical protein